jgi:hypothetical protein
MATSVPSGEEAAAHLSTDQWQSFEIRMRRRRVERLLARVEEACQQGREDAAGEAIAEIEQLSPYEPRLPQLRSRVETIAAVASTRTAALPIEDAVVTTVPAPAEFTPSIDYAAVVVPQIAEPHPIRASSPDPLISDPDDLVFDLPLAVDEAERIATVPNVELERKHNKKGLALAAVALLVCGVGGYLLGPNVLTLVTPPLREAIAQRETPVTVTEQAKVEDGTDAVQPREALPPVHVAVDEVPAANTTLERGPAAAQPISQPIVPSPPATTPATPPTTPAPPAATEPPRATPTSVAPNESTATSEKPAIPAPAENTASIPEIPASSSPASIEPGAPVATPPPPPREPARSAARDEDKIRAVLGQYASAYSRLDAAAASAIFPGIDRRALARAFDGLSSQTVSLGACDVRVAIETAIVDCAGTATWTPKIGGGSRTEPRRWQFRLRDLSGDWQIVAAKVR